MHHAIARPDSQFLYCTFVYFLCDILWPEVQSHSDDSRMHATGLRSVLCMHSGEARPSHALGGSGVKSIYQFVP